MMAVYKVTIEKQVTARKKTQELVKLDGERYGYGPEIEKDETTKYDIYSQWVSDLNVTEIVAAINAASKPL